MLAGPVATVPPGVSVRPEKSKFSFPPKLFAVTGGRLFARAIPVAFSVNVLVS
jgi:hypothetical protein